MRCIVLDLWIPALHIVPVAITTYLLHYSAPDVAETSCIDQWLLASTYHGCKPVVSYICKHDMCRDAAQLQRNNSVVECMACRVP